VLQGASAGSYQGREAYKVNEQIQKTIKIEAEVFPLYYSCADEQIMGNSYYKEPRTKK
jgi:hypothetical protein